jgi:hypothetical protein
MSSSSGKSQHPGHASPSPSGQSHHLGHVSAQSPVSKSSTTHSAADKKEEGEPGDATVDVRSMPSQSDTTISPPKSPDPLETFHSALGIPAPKPEKAKRSFFGRKKPASDVEQQAKLTKTNQGVYLSVLSYERWARIRYHVCDFVVTVSMFLQIIVGASVTAFGAATANHILITVFGAANTALASLLAVLKSQGLPNRLRQDWNMWRDLREYIEERERAIDMAFSGKLPGAAENQKDIDVQAEIKTIEGKYKDVKLTLEANRPDTYEKINTTTTK